MDFRIDGNPDYGQLKVELRPGERIVAEGGSMAWMSAGTKVKVRLLGGLFKALIRRLVAKESLFVAEYSHPGIGSVTFSPATPGSVAHRRLDGDSFILTAGSFMACTPGVELKTRFAGLRGLFSGEGGFFIECTGHGEVFYNSFGAVLEKEINGTFLVDTGYVVAWEPGLSYSISGMGNLKSTVLSGEGLVMRFSGAGKLYLQTRTLSDVAGWLTPFGRK
jgi:uncharacterized protein (TIGR00266 family)